MTIMYFFSYKKISFYYSQFFYMRKNTKLLCLLNIFIIKTIYVYGNVMKLKKTTFFLKVMVKYTIFFLLASLIF